MFAEHEAEKDENHKSEGGDQSLRLRRCIHQQEYQDQGWSNYTDLTIYSSFQWRKTVLALHPNHSQLYI